jgi:hypothetical protein
MERILFVTTQYRAGERIYPIIPILSSKCKLDLLKIYHMDPVAGRWGGDRDMRTLFDYTYTQYFETITNQIDDLDFSNYKLILADDCRLQSGLGDVYNRRQCLLIGNSHGNNALGYPIINHRICFDGCFVFGEKEATLPHLIPGGIPSNDALINYKLVDKQHILIITGFIGESQRFTDVTGFTFGAFDRDFVDKLQMRKLQARYNLPFVIKVKSREDLKYEQVTQYIESIMPKDVDYSIIVDVEDDNLLIAQSAAVISNSSTLTLKALQLNIPTAIIRGYGYTDEGFALYRNCNNVVDLDYDQIVEALNTPADLNFITQTIQGGATFNSTAYYVNYINQLIQNS